MNYTTKKSYISKLSSSYIKYSLENQAKQNKFLKTLSITNKFSGEILNLKSDFLQKNRDDYLYFCFQSISMQNRITENYTAVFITCSLPSRYHPFKTIYRGKKEVKSYKNTKFDDFGSGNKIFTAFFRSVYNDFKVSRKRVKLQYQKVIEPHKTFVPHLHALVYVPTINLDSFISHVKNQIKNFGLGREHKIEVINDLKRSSAYLLKYIRKNLDGTDSTHSQIIDGWKRVNRIRIYTHSASVLPKFIFQKLSRVLKLHIDKGQNILEEISKICDITVSYTEGSEVRFKKYSGIYSKFKVNIDISVKTCSILTSDDVKEDLSDAYSSKDFTVIQNSSYLDKRSFYSYIHSVNELSEELIYLGDYDFNSYFNLMSDIELIELWESYLLEYGTKLKKSYKLDEFKITFPWGLDVYKKSDWVLT